MTPDTEGLADTVGLIGGIGLTEVHVYAQRPAPDGKLSGCPHVHAVTDEAYFVLRGGGSVELHDLRNGFRTLPLAAGDYVHFPPLVMHRLISDGELVILGIMGNAGLAERGEARIYFGADVDADPSRFEQLVGLPTDRGLEGALDRRDASVRAHMRLIELWSADRDAYFTELARFFKIHCDAMADRADTLAEQVRDGPMASAAATLRRIDKLPEFEKGRAEIQINRRGQDFALGMCGELRPILSLETFGSLKSV